MNTPNRPDHFALYLAARRARAEAIGAALRALAGLFRGGEQHAGWSLAPAPRSR